MAYNEAVAGTTVPAIGDESNVGEFGAHDGRAGFELFRHSRPAFGTFVADDHDDVLAVRDAAGIEGGVEFVFFVEDLGVRS
jgi:hypothetical protein